MIQHFKKYTLPVLIVTGALFTLQSAKYSEPLFYVSTVDKKVVNSLPFYKQKVVVEGQTPTVHSATAVQLANGQLLAMWYGGTREGHIDVALYSAIFDQTAQTWSIPKKVLDRYDVADSLNLYVKKVGNPVLIKHPQGPLVLVYVSVSMAGWATSRLNMVVSYDDGQSWHNSKRLITSPFFNISTLVKNDAVIYDDGTIGITAYHELKGEYSEIVRVNIEGQVINQYRMTSGTNTIQPSVIVKSSNKAIALIRDSGRDVQRVHFTETHDGGKSWSPYEALAIKNPNAAVYGFNDTKQRTWMVFNDSTRDIENSRNNLSLAVSENNGKDWRTLHYFENAELDSNVAIKYSYPWVLNASDGEYHLMYTVDRKLIKQVSFNQAWLEALL
ncbi:MAG: putative neuraminidase [Crocinitomicaceae bacterium]